MVKRKKNKIFINNKVVKTFKKVKDIIIVKTFPGYIPNHISGMKALNYINPKTKNILLSDAVIKIREYINRVQYLTCIKDTGVSLIIYLEKYNKEVSLSWQSLYNENKKNNLKAELEQNIQIIFDTTENLLKFDYSLFFINGKRVYTIYEEEKLIKFLEIINNSKKNEKKIREIKKYKFDDIPNILLLKKMM